MNPPRPTAPPAGRSIKAFAAEAGVCAATIYNLQPEFRPRSTRIGQRVVVIEPPLEWLARIAEMGGARTRKWARPPEVKATRAKPLIRTRGAKG